MRVLIVGGGIGGLTTAAALRREGHEVVVFERIYGMSEVGAGLSLWPNAMLALRRIGLEGRVSAIAQRLRHSQLRAPGGEILVDLSLDLLEQNLGAPMVAVHRADLQRVLLDAAGDDVVRLGQAVAGVTQDARGVTARLAGGEEVRGDVLVGADGIHSRVRALLLGDESPRYAGYTAWRGVTARQPEWTDPDRWTATETHGPGARFGLVPIGGERVYWFATDNVPQGEGDSPAGRRRDVLDRFAGWHAPVAAVVAATGEGAILRNDIVDRPPVKRWSFGRLTLLGDAAHAMTPNLGQGACQAIEDAVALAGCLRDVRDPLAALRCYEERRLRQANRFVTQSWQFGRLLQLENRAAFALRNRIVKATPPGITLRQFTSRLREP